VSGPLVDPSDVPEWLAPLVVASRGLDAETLTRHRLPPPEDGTRAAAVLILFGLDAHGPDVLLTERAAGLRDHAGQVSFPGGGAEPGDADAIATALREATEETGVRPVDVQPIALLPELFIPPSGFSVTPVLAHWRAPAAVAPVDPAETAAVARVPVAELVEPANRFQVRHPSGYVGPAFEVAGMVVWGFTGGLLAALLTLGGWDRPWDRSQVRELDVAWAMARRRAGDPAGRGRGGREAAG
jgi:8-oxo-dGTP pyrophosphatase MutT (NUDIX family)